MLTITTRGAPRSLGMITNRGRIANHETPLNSKKPGRLAADRVPRVVGLTSPLLKLTCEPPPGAVYVLGTERTETRGTLAQ
jgi:hypothetical protein